MRRYVEAGMGVLSSRRAEELARKMVEQGQTGKDQVTKVARDLIDWSKKNGERLAKQVRSEVRKQIVALGVATKSDVETLRRRIDKLEGRGSAARSTGATGSSPKKSTAKKSTAKKTTTAKPTAAKSTTRKTTRPS
ncbi:MAG TPA: hypothetical protein VM638_00265 [Actinomycetota bacterium]|nr:hypothetical protein [Actinomycetota bacterium]